MDNSILPINNPFVKLMPETVGIDNDVLRAPSPQKLHAAYNSQVMKGVILKSSGYPFNRFAQYNFDYLKANQEDGYSLFFEETPYYSRIKGSGQGKRFCGHHSWLKLDPQKAGWGAQITGDCVSWAIRAALDRLRSMGILISGRFERYIIRQATCGIYSGRGHTGQGADPIALSAWAVKIGTLLEQIYKTATTQYDFTNYDEYVRWGMSRGRSGMPADLLELTKPFTASSYKVIQTTEAARDFIAAGGTIHCGSDLGVSSSGNPISRRQGSWSHDMDVPGFDDTKEFFDFCVWMWDQSWGNWNTVSGIPEPWKPITQGMFFLDDKTTQWAFNDSCVGFMPGSWFKADPINNLI